MEISWKIYIISLVENINKEAGQLLSKAHFLIATTLKYREGHYSFPWIIPLTLDLYFIMLNVKQEAIMYLFLSLWYDLTSLPDHS